MSIDIHPSSAPLPRTIAQYQDSTPIKWQDILRNNSYLSNTSGSQKLRVHFSLLGDEAHKSHFKKSTKKKVQTFLENFFDTYDQTLLKNDAFFVERYDCTTKKFEYKLKIWTKSENEMVSYTEITDIPSIITHLNKEFNIEVHGQEESDLCYSLPIVVFGFTTTRYYLEDDRFYDFTRWKVKGHEHYYVVGTKEFTSSSPSQIEQPLYLSPTLSKALACLYSTLPKEARLMKHYEEQVLKTLLTLNPPLDPSTKTPEHAFFSEFFKGQL